MRCHLDKVKRVVKENNQIWKTESAYWNFVRGGLRRGLWMRNPVKIMFKNKLRERIPNPDPLKREGRWAEVWGNQCNLCNQWFVQSEVEVDHKIGHHSLVCAEDLINYFESIAFVVEDDLQLVCKECHKTKSYADRMNISFEMSRLTRDVIELQRTNGDKYKLLQLGIDSDKIPSTKDGRRALLIDLLSKEA